MRRVNPNVLHNQSIAYPMSGYASSGITTLRGIDRLESIEAILPTTCPVAMGMCGRNAPSRPGGPAAKHSRTQKSLCKNLLDKMMGAPGLVFETWDPPSKCRKTI